MLTIMAAAIINLKTLTTTPVKATPKIVKVESKPVAPSPPVTYTVADGDNLTTIADSQQTTWQRLFNKNTDLSDPNVLTIGQNLLVPKPDEVLTDRPVSTPIPVPVGSSTAPTKPIIVSEGNTYSYGYCTWYVKNRRPDIPNSWGDAFSWLYNAQAMGWPTGSAPRAGAIGQAGDHVVYVESVNGDGTVTISEMNYNAWNVVDQRTVPASSFNYIY